MRRSGDSKAMASQRDMMHFKRWWRNTSEPAAQSLPIESSSFHSVPPARSFRFCLRSSTQHPDRCPRVQREFFSGGKKGRRGGKRGRGWVGEGKLSIIAGWKETQERQGRGKQKKEEGGQEWG